LGSTDEGTALWIVLKKPSNKLEKLQV
jgi:hypothetical protein